MMNFESQYPNVYAEIKRVREQKVCEKDDEKETFKADCRQEIIKLPQMFNYTENVKFEHV